MVVSLRVREMTRAANEAAKYQSMHASQARLQPRVRQS